MVREDAVPKRIAVESNGEIIRYLGDDERTTRTVIEKTLAKRSRTPPT